METSSDDGSFSGPSDGEARGGRRGGDDSKGAWPRSYSHRLPILGWLLFCFTVVTVAYAGIAVSGFLMFGESTMSQFTLNLPQQYIPSKIAIWMTIVNPYTKYALTMTPVALSIEEALPKKVQNYLRVNATSLRPLTFSAGDGIAWICLHNACGSDTPMRVLPLHQEGCSAIVGDHPVHSHHNDRRRMCMRGIIHLSQPDD
ncbi:hypothetical protein Zm00014a_010599 [Zea mays]|uniref:Amino acid transporter transmembrane domain-containing protein n=1 Tax=Zea mays TaxID=4577 RepID=A0A317Y7Y3_MAIZE|nr:hypothetical protein Zm00014a_010599 [Zea mays]